MEKDLGVDIPSDSVIDYEDTHGGFHGDGELYVKVEFPKDFAMSQLNQYWKRLPVPTGISLFIFGGDYNGVHYEYGDDRMKPAGKITNGIYFFEDRADYPSKSNSFLERPSHNFTFAIYDFEENTLYFYKYDS